MWDRVKVVLQVRVHHPEVARFKMPVHFTQRVFAAQILPKAEAPRLELMLKDWLDHQFQGRLNYAVLHRRDTERTLPLALGYVHTSYRLRAIAPVPQRLRHFAQVAGPCLRESLHAHPVYARRPSVAFDLCPSQLQRFKTRYFIDQTMPFASPNSACRAANIASVQIGAGANFRCMQLPSALASRLVVSDTGDASTFISALSALSGLWLSTFLPSLP
jgi:hypothetical protein